MIQTATATLAPEEKREGCCDIPDLREAQSGSKGPDPNRHQAHQRQNSHAQHGNHHESASLNHTALMATVHCLTGCTIGEVLGMAIGTGLGWGNWPTVGLAVGLAFSFGYAMTLWPLRRAGMAWRTAFGLAFASDTLSISTMEFVDNAIMVAIPGAMDAGLSEPLFWGSLALSLVLAGVAAFPVNRWLIARGKGHAVVHAYHG